ncbi:MAG: hypothetical protein U0822_24940 [Anaerolineae bacterium]
MAASVGPQLDTDIVQGAFVQGAWRTKDPGVGVFPGEAMGHPDRGLLLAVVELAGPDEGKEALGQQMLDAAQKAYFSSTGTETNGLRLAVEAANEALYLVNSTVERDARRHGGIGLATLIGPDLYIAQGGPSLIYIVQAGDLLQFPSDSPWISGGDEDAADGGWYPLGVRRNIRADLYHVEVGDGDLAVLTSPSVAHFVSRDTLHTVLEQSPEGLATEIVQMAATQSPPPELGLIAVRLEEIEGVAAPPNGVNKRGYAQPKDVAEKAATVSLMGRMSGWLGQTSKSAASSVGRGAGGVLKQTLPDDARGTPAVPRGPSLWRWLALIIVVLVIAAVAFTTFRSMNQRRQEDAQVALLLSQAQERVTAATGSQADKQSVMNLLRDAEAKVNEALKIRPSDENAKRLLQTIQLQTEQVGGIYRLADWAPVLAANEPGAVMKYLQLNGQQLYAMDTGLGRVFRQRLGAGATPEVALKSGDTVGTRTVGDLGDMVWLRSGGARTVEDVGAIARDGILWEVSPTGAPTAIQMPGSKDWQNPLIADTYGGNVYLLQPDSSQILKYVASGNDGYQAPAAWLSDKVDLKGAIDMGIDGDVYILMGDGHVRRFTGGKEDTKFSVQGIDLPLTNPQALFVPQDGKSLYILDNGRVVEVSKDGVFQRQFRGPTDKSMDDPRGLYVDTSANKLYVINGNSVFSATIPAAGAGSAAQPAGTAQPVGTAPPSATARPQAQPTTRP